MQLIEAAYSSTCQAGNVVPGLYSSTATYGSHVWAQPICVGILTQAGEGRIQEELI